MLLVASASAAVSLNKISSDPFTNPSSQHATQVEPDTFASGSTIVSAFQSGRFFDGGASDIGWATSTNGGTNWQNGFLPGITKYQGNGPYDRVSDPSVAFDARHGVWIISSLALDEPSVIGVAVVASRSTNGLSWNNPVTVGTGASVDKNWTVCDNSSGSPHYGNCYTQWDDNGNGNRIKMSTSTDGGLTWGVARETANAANGLGGQPVVQPNGTVVVPANNANETAIIAFRSTNGGASWGNAATVTSIPSHDVAASLRSGPLPSAEVDGAGKVYVVWQDCRFRSNCSANDIVMTSSADGVNWSAVTRIPIHSTGSTFDHFIPGIAVDKSTSGASARLALAYYYYPNASCTASTCQLDAGLTSSADGGQTWTSPVQVAGPLRTAWLANTSQGPMVGDYISTSITGGTATTVVAIGLPHSGSAFDEGMYAPVNKLPIASAAEAIRPSTTSGAAPITGQGIGETHHALRDD